MSKYLAKVSSQVQDLTRGSMEDLKQFYSKKIGEYKLLQNNLEKYPKGYIYINSEEDWNQLSEGNFTFNIFDNTGYNIYKLLKEQIVLYLSKTHFIIIKLESSSKKNYVYFYLNSNPEIIDEQNGIIQFKIVKSDFIGSQGSPNLNDIYNLSYMLKDPSNEKSIVELPLLVTSKLSIPKNGAQFITDKQKDLQNTKPIQTETKIPDPCDFGEIIKHQNIILFIISLLVILFFIKY